MERWHQFYHSQRNCWLKEEGDLGLKSATGMPQALHRKSLQFGMANPYGPVEYGASIRRIKTFGML